MQLVSEKQYKYIIHIDMDAFYAQVEQKRRNIPADVTKYIEIISNH